MTINSLLKMINLDETIKSKLSDIYGAFSKYYHIPYEEVEKHFENLFIAKHIDPDKLFTLFLDIKQIKAKEMSSKFIEQSKITEEELSSLFGAKKDSTINFDYNYFINEYNKFKKFHDMPKAEKKRLKEKEAISFFSRYFKGVTLDNLYLLKDTEQYKHMLENEYLRDAAMYYINPDLYDIDYERSKSSFSKFLSTATKMEVTEDTIENIYESGKLSRIIDLANIFNKVKSEYDEFLSQFKSIEILQKKYMELERELDYKYNLKILDEYFSEFAALKYIDQSDYDDYKNNKILSKKLENIIGLCSPILSFSKKSYEDESNPVKANIIRNSRMSFFKTLGIDHGDNYEEYLIDPICVSLTPSTMLVEKISAIQDKYESEKRLKKMSLAPSFSDVRKQIDDLNLLCKDDSYCLEELENIRAAIVPNAIRTSEGIKLFSLLIYGLDTSSDTLDCSLIHELNHQFELCINSINEEGIEYTTGWDVITQTYEKTNEEQDLAKKREFELFNEVINELIAQEITQQMHSDGNYVFYDEKDQEKAKSFSRTSYDITIPLVKEFFNTYKNDILLSRRDGNINHIFDVVGHDNFMALNHLVVEFSKNFDQIRMIKINNDIKNKQLTDDVKYLINIYDRRDEILKSMSEYSNSLTK